MTVHNTRKATLLQSLTNTIIHYMCYAGNLLETGSLQTKLNAGLSEQQQEDLFQLNEVSTK